MKTRTALSCCLLLTAFTASHAEIIKAIGIGSTAIKKKDLNLTRQLADQAAQLDAIRAMIIKVNGPQALRDAEPLLAEIAKQIDPSYFSTLDTRTDENKQLVRRLSLEIDDQEFRSILNDYGLAKKSSRSSPIMIVMDEYFAIPRDSSKPAKEFTAYLNDQSYSQSEYAGYDSRERAKSSSYESTSARGQSSSAYAAGYAEKNHNNYHNRATAAASASYAADENAYYANNERQNDIQSFVHYVEYQTPSVTPERVNHTLNSIAQHAAKYDLRLLDSDLFRSQYLKGRSMSIQQLLSDTELAQFAAAARSANADWFMAGSSHIFDRGRSPATGQYVCDGAVSFKIYSVDDASLMGGETRTESSSAGTAEACRASVAAKLGQLTISNVGPQILNYAKNRSMYGQQITLLVKSAGKRLSSGLGDDLYALLEEVSGVNDINIRTQNAQYIELNMQYKSSKPFTVELNKVLRRSIPALAASQPMQQGNTVTLCIGGQQCK